MTVLPRRAAVAAATLAAAVVAPLAVPGAADAASARRTDGTGDIWTADSSGDNQSEVDGPGTNVDLTRFLVRHGDTGVALRATYTDLETPAEGQTFWMTSKLRTNEGRSYLAYVRTNAANPAGVAVLQDADGAVTCDGLVAKVDYDTEVVRLVVPRRCLSAPRSVKWWAYASERLPAAEEGGEPTYLYDDASSDEALPSGYQPAVVRG